MGDHVWSFQLEQFSLWSQVLCISFDPRGNDILAASCLSGQIMFWNVVSAQTVGAIDGLRDIQTARHWHEMFSAINSRGIKAGRGMRKRSLVDHGTWPKETPIGHDDKHGAMCFQWSTVWWYFAWWIMNGFACPLDPFGICTFIPNNGISQLCLSGSCLHWHGKIHIDTLRWDAWLV